MRKDKELVQMGIVVKPEVREWFVNKCSQARTNEGRIVSISTIIGYYLEKLKELDDLDPFNTCPILKRDESYPLDSLETSTAVDWTYLVNPIKEQIKDLEVKFNEITDYEQQLALLESKLTNTIDNKINLIFFRLQEETLLNPITITSDSAVGIDEAITPILTRLEQLESDFEQSKISDSDLTCDSLSNLDDLNDDLDNEAVATPDNDERLEKEDLFEAKDTQGEEVTLTETMTKSEMARRLKVSPSTVTNWIRQSKWSKFPSGWEWNIVREHFEKI